MADFASFAFIITLAAVVNGLGIVRWLTGLAEYLSQRETLDIKHYWVYSLSASFQFLLHILMWWSLWGVRDAPTINFLMYVYLLAGPVLLYLGTSVLAPDVDGDTEMKKHYFSVRPTYSSVLSLVWIWAILITPVLRGEFAPTMPMYVLFLAAALMQRITNRPAIQALVAIVNWLLLIVFVGLYAIRLGGVNA